MSGINKREENGGGAIDAVSTREKIVALGDGYGASFAQEISQNAALIFGVDIQPISPATSRNVLFYLSVYSEVTTEIRLNESVVFSGTEFVITPQNLNRLSSNVPTQFAVSRRDDGVTNWGTYLIPSSSDVLAFGLFFTPSEAGTYAIDGMIMDESIYALQVINRHTASGFKRVGVKFEFYEYD